MAPTDAAIALPYSIPDLFGHDLGLRTRQLRESFAEQRHEQVVVAHGELERHVLLGHAVTLRRPAGTGTLGALDGDLDVAAAGELVEMMAGDVRMDREVLGHL